MQGNLANARFDYQSVFKKVKTKQIKKKENIH